MKYILTSIITGRFYQGTQPLVASVPIISNSFACSSGVNREFNRTSSDSNRNAEFGVTVDRTLPDYQNPLNTFSIADATLCKTNNVGYQTDMKRTTLFNLPLDKNVPQNEQYLYRA